MRRVLLLALLGAPTVTLAVAACVGDSPDGGGTPGPDATAAETSSPDAATNGDDGATDTGSGPPCDLGKDFASPVLVPGIATGDTEYGARLTDDELTVVFTRKSASSGHRLMTARRASPTGTFDTPKPVVVENGAPIEAWLSGDGLRLVYVQSTGGSFDLFSTTRGSVAGDFGAGTNLGVGTGPNTSDASELQPFLSDDGKELWFVSNRGTGNDLYRSTSTGGVFGPGGVVVEVSSPQSDTLPVISRDRKTVYFQSSRPFDGGPADLVWVAKRDTDVGEFGAPQPLTSVGSGAPSWVSLDGCRLYLSSDVSGQDDVYVATRPK